jgi:hypothetical protein
MTELEQTSRDLQQIQEELRDADFGDGTFGETTGEFGEPTDPAPAAADRGRFRGTVQEITGDRATLVGTNGQAHEWYARDPGVYGSLALNRGEEVLVYWELRGDSVHVVGVDGPRSSTPELPG